MKRLSFLFLLMFALSVNATTYTEFYCTQAGTNINSGSSPWSTNYFTAQGFWTNATWTFYNATLNPVGFNIGDFASVYTNTATVAAFVSRITATNATTITLSGTAFGGTSPANDTAGFTWITIGGAWHGAFGAVLFPFTLVTNTMTDAAGDVPRVNFSSAYSNNISSAITYSFTGPIVFQGYTSTPGDGGKGIIDGGGNGLNGMVTVSGKAVQIIDMFIQNNSSAAAYVGASITGSGCQLLRVVARWIGGSGFNSTGAPQMIECESYMTDQNNNAAQGGFTGNGCYVRCFAHDCTNVNAAGFYNIGGPMILVNCLSISNGIGIKHDLTAVSGAVSVLGCESYGNLGSGFDSVNATLSTYYIENSNFLNNNLYGINNSGSGIRQGAIVQYGIGNGAGITNVVGNVGTNLADIYFGSSITHSSLPYIGATTNNYSVVNTSAGYGKGKGSFTDVAHSGGTASYPNVGATTLTNATTSSSVSGGSYTFAQ